jgi:stage V sporulation protein G
MRFTQVGRGVPVCHREREALVRGRAMEITEVKVFPIQEEKLKAFVSIVFDQCFMVNDIKIIQGRDGLFISMPSRKKKNGEFKDVAHPLNNETRRMIEEKVLAEYERVLGERGERLPAPLHPAHPLPPPAQVTPGHPAAAAAESVLAATGPFPLPRPLDGGSGGDGAGLKGPAAPVAAPPAASGGEAAQAPTQQASPSPEKTLDEIEELHLRDSFWTVT